MRKEKNVKNRAMRRKMLKKSGKKLLAAALSAAMLSMGIYPAGFPVNVSAEEAVAQVADAVAYKAKVDISKLSPINGVITYDITEDGNYYFEGSNNFNESYIPTSIIVAPGVKAGIYFDGVDIENYDGAIPSCTGSEYIEGTTPVYISEYAQVSLHTLNKSTIKLLNNASAIVVSKNAYCEINDDLELDVETNYYCTGIDVAGTFEMNGGILYIEGNGGSVGIGVCDIYATEDYSDSNIIINDGTLDIYTMNAPAIGVYAGYESSADKKYNFGNIEIHGGQIVASTSDGVSTIGVRDYDYSKVYSECNGIIIDGGNLTLEQNILRGDGNKPAVYPGKEVTDGAVVIAGGNIYNTVSDRYDESLSSEIKIKDRFGGNDVSRKVLTLSEQTEREIINITSCDADGNSYYYGNNDMKTDKEGKLYTYLSDGMTTVQVALSDRSIMEGTVSGDAAELSLIEDKSNVPVFSKSHYSFNYNDELTIDTPTVGADCDISYSYAEKKTPDAAPQDNTQWTKLSSLSDVKSLKTGAYWLKASSSDAQAGGVTYRAADTIVSVNVKSCSNHMCDNWVVNEENDDVETAVCSICGETVYRTHDYSDKTGVCKNCKYKCRHTSLKYEYQTEKSHEIVCRACGYSESVEHNWQENLGTVKEAGYTFAYDEESSSWISDTSCIDSSTAKTVWIFDMEQEGTVSFEWGVSSEENYDYLNVFLDEDSVYEQKIIDKKSGNESSGYITGEAVTPELTAGQHMLTAYYVKDSGTREGLDKAYIKFSSDFKYSEVKENTNTSNSRFEYDEERQRWTCNGYQEDDDGSNSKKIGLTITCEEDCKLPFHIGLPQCGEVYMSSNSLERYLNSSDEMLWINFNKGNNNLFFEWYWESEDAEAASNEAFYIEYIPAASHICVDCGYLDDHEYSSECDEDCNICGQLRTPSETHKYSSDCDTVCNDCGYQRKVQAEHQFGADGKADKCDNCGVLNIAGMKFDNDKLRLIYNAKEQCPEIVLKDSEGNVISSDKYSVEITSESAVSTEDGYTFTVSGNGVDAVGSQSGKWSIEYLSTDAEAIAEGTKKTDSEWFNSDVKIKAPTGYLIANSNGADAVWTDYLEQDRRSAAIVVSEDGSTYITYYLKNILTGGITDAKSVLIKKDSSVTTFEVKTATGEAAGLTSDDDSVRVTFFAEDLLSGIDNVKYSLDGKDEVSVVSGDSILITAPGVHVLTATASDKAGNIASSQIQFTISEKPDETPNPGETPSPGETPNPGETEKPGETPKPSETPSPSETPKPSETPSPSETPNPATLAGDVDCNNKVDLNDAIIVLKLALGIPVEVTEQGRVNADYDENGKINLSDAQYTLKAALGIKVNLSK